jgi:hypothetical protein
VAVLFSKDAGVQRSSVDTLWSSSIPGTCADAMRATARRAQSRCDQTGSPYPSSPFGAGACCRAARCHRTWEEGDAYAYPRRIEFTTELANALTGKIRLIELRKAERERVGSAD